MKKGGFDYYPESKGQRWTFQATKMSEFLETYFQIRKTVTHIKNIRVKSFKELNIA